MEKKDWLEKEKKRYAHQNAFNRQYIGEWKDKEMSSKLKTKDILAQHNAILYDLTEHIERLSKHTRVNVHDRGHYEHPMLCARFNKMRDDLFKINKEIATAYEEGNDLDLLDMSKKI